METSSVGRFLTAAPPAGITHKARVLCQCHSQAGGGVECWFYIPPQVRESGEICRCAAVPHFCMGGRQQMSHTVHPVKAHVMSAGERDMLDDH